MTEVTRIVDAIGRIKVFEAVQEAMTRWIIVYDDNEYCVCDNESKPPTVYGTFAALTEATALVKRKRVLEALRMINRQHLGYSLMQQDDLWATYRKSNKELDTLDSVHWCLNNTETLWRGIKKKQNLADKMADNIEKGKNKSNKIK